MTLAYACDENYAALTAISAVSALRHNPGARILLLGYGLSEAAQGLVRSRVEAHGGAFRYADVSAAIDRIRRAGRASAYSSYAVYSRFFIADVLPDEPTGRAVYLDCDTLVAGSLAPLFALDLKGRACALGGDCIPRAYKRFVGVPDDRPYFNSGVMPVDLAAWRTHNCRDRLLAELDHPRAPNPLGDQDILPRVLGNDIAPLAPEWNCLSQFLMHSYDGVRRIVGGGPGGIPFSREAYDRARRGAAVYHFSGHTLGRPWYRESRHPLRERYREAAREAGLAEVAEQSRPLMAIYRIQYLLWRFLPQPLFDRVSYLLYRLNIRRSYGV